MTSSKNTGKAWEGFELAAGLICFLIGFGYFFGCNGSQIVTGLILLILSLWLIYHGLDVFLYPYSFFGGLESVQPYLGQR